ncbi:MAG: hypothetical protein KJO69_06370 [Gammaproteobacteria bacterium]|nr:hypothetical protein [Gammaproteobacteria bacterium]
MPAINPALLAQGIQGVDARGNALGVEQIRASESGRALTDSRNRLLGLQTAQYERDQPLRDAQQQTGISSAEFKSVVTGASELKSYLDAGDQAGATQYLAGRLSELKQREMDTGVAVNTQDTEAAIRMASAGQWDQLQQITDSIVERGQGFMNRNTNRQFGAGTRVKATTQSGKVINGMVIPQNNPVDGTSTANFVPFAGALDPNDPIVSTENVGVLGATFGDQEKIRTNEQLIREEGKDDIKTEGEAKRETNQKTIVREQGFIDEAIDVGDSLPEMKRAVQLLKLVKTGGIDAARIQAKQYFGIESADEGELVSKLGVAVLSRLRQTFGAQFTENEGKRLEGVSARIGANTDTNIRLLNGTIRRMEREIRRGLKFAEKYEDSDAADLINESLNFNLTPASEQGRFTVTVVTE